MSPNLHFSALVLKYVPQNVRRKNSRSGQSRVEDGGSEVMAGEGTRCQAQNRIAFVKIGCVLWASLGLFAGNPQ